MRPGGSKKKKIISKRDTQQSTCSYSLTSFPIQEEVLIAEVWGQGWLNIKSDYINQHAAACEA